MPDRICVDYRNKSIVYMPCFCDDIFGTKILSIFPENKKIGKPTIYGLMLLNDFVTGEPLALLDGKTVTALRTGAVGAVGTRYLAGKNCTALGIIGAGTQGFYQALFICLEKRINKVFLYDSFRKDYAFFITELKAKLGRPVEIIVCEKVEQLLAESEIIVTTTTATDPVIPDNVNLLRGKCFIGVGSYQPHVREYPDAIWDAVEEVYVDLAFAMEESGDLSQPLASGRIIKDQVKELGYLICHPEEQAKARKETTFFKTVGMAAFDLCAAQLIYENALKKQIGHNLSL